jgi:RNA polymerase sigma factor (sigma-70 family)
MQPSQTTSDAEDNGQHTLTGEVISSSKKEKHPHPDQKYINALLNNDALVLNELYQKFAGKIKLMVLQNNGTEADAADIVQDALLMIYQKAKSKGFILTCPFDAFFYIICKNKWITELNKRNTHTIKWSQDEKYDALGEDSFKLAEELRVEQERKDLLLLKFKELSDGNKKLLYLSWSGKSMEEVAQILNVSYGYARKKKSYCIMKLIELVKQSPEYAAIKS